MGGGGVKGWCYVTLRLCEIKACYAMDGGGVKKSRFSCYVVSGRTLRDHSKLMSADIRVFSDFFTPPLGHFFDPKNVPHVINVRSINVPNPRKTSVDKHVQEGI